MSNEAKEFFVINKSLKTNIMMFLIVSQRIDRTLQSAIHKVHKKYKYLPPTYKLSVPMTDLQALKTLFMKLNLRRKKQCAELGWYKFSPKLLDILLCLLTKKGWAVNVI